MSLRNIYIEILIDDVGYAINQRALGDKATLISMLDELKALIEAEPEEKIEAFIQQATPEHRNPMKAN